MLSNYVIDSERENVCVCVPVCVRVRAAAPMYCGLDTHVAQTHTWMYEYIAGVKIPVAWEARW